MLSLLNRSPLKVQKVDYSKHVSKYIFLVKRNLHYKTFYDLGIYMKMNENRQRKHANVCKIATFGCKMW